MSFKILLFLEFCEAVVFISLQVFFDLATKMFWCVLVTSGVSDRSASWLILYLV